MNEPLKELMDLCKEYTLLYVEDDVQTQESMNAILTRMFKEVHLANNGEEGLILFQQYSPDIVITDIQMPKLNGLEMAKAIKELSEKTPIIITTAFNEERYFLMAIENGVDSFLLKPIDKQKLLHMLTKTVTHLAYHAKAQERETLKKVEEINRASEESIQNLSNLLPFPALFYKGNQLIFINTHAQKTFERVSLESFTHETTFVSKFHITKDKKQKIKLPTANGLNRSYWVYPNALFIGVDYALVQAYIFVDITVMEYQKLRLNVYSQSFAKNPVEPTQSSTNISDTKTMSARAFFKSLDYKQRSTVEEFQELYEYAVHFSYDFQHAPSDALRAKIIEIYGCYASLMHILPEFQELGVMVNKVIHHLIHTPIGTQESQKLSSLLRPLSEALVQWYTTLFITQSATDIHHCDSAIKASCLHVNVALPSDTRKDVSHA